MIVSNRKAAVAGRFYPGTSFSLKELMDRLLAAEQKTINLELCKRPIIGGIVPHAGMIYSGYQAVHFYELVRQSKQVFDTIVIVNPNHRGYGNGYFNTCDYDTWETPLGKVETDSEFIDKLDIEPNNQAHDYEHSGEIQLPFAQYFFPFSFKIAMITMNVQQEDSAYLLAQKIYEAAIQTQRKILVIASSDFNHYESAEEGFNKDQHVIDRILKFDVGSVYSAVKKYQVSACGYGPIMALLHYSLLSAKYPQIELLKRGHSGEVYPSEEVVDYVSFLVSGTNNA